MFKERKSISYSLLVKMFAEGAEPTLPAKTLETMFEIDEDGPRTNELGKRSFVRVV